MSVESRDHFYCPRCLSTFEADRERCANLNCARPKPAKGWGRILQPGAVFDRNYRVHRMLALGGAGVTYVGRELGPDGEETGPLLAIKVLLSARDQGPYLARLANEARIIQDLDHPNIVRYLGFVHRPGHSPYLITGFEAGGSLLDHMRRHGVLDLRRAVGVVRQVCWALEKAHDRGVVHRDLKPENVLLTREYGPDEELVVRVADFGIAKVTGSLGSNLTRVGAFVGTPLYAAPEQFVGGDVTKAVDVYGAGAMLHFLITGRPVVRFADQLEPADTYDLLRKELPPRLGDLPGATPEEVRRIETVLASAMAFEPERRCTVVELDEMLGAVMAGRDPVPPPRPASAGGAVSADGAGIAVASPTISSLGPPPPAPVTADGSGPSASPATTAPGGAAPGGAVTSSPTLSLDPQGGGPEARRRRWPLLLVAVLVLLLGLGGGGAWFALDRLGLLGPEPLELTADMANPAARRDHEAIRRSLDNLRDWLAKGCAVPAGTELELELVVDGDGRVRRAGASGGGEVGACVARHVERATFTRTGDATVRVRLPLRW